MIIEATIGMLLVGWLLFRQTQPRPVRSSPRGAIIVTVVGAVLAYKFVSAHPVATIDELLFAASLVLGIGFAVVRAHTVRIYRDPAGVLVTRGTMFTLALWAGGIATHIGIDLVGDENLSMSTLTLYIGVVALAQTLIVLYRARSAGHLRDATNPPARQLVTTSARRCP